MADTNADYFKLELTNTLNQTLNLSDLAHYVAEDSDGFGMLPIQRIRESTTNLNGEIDLGFHLLPRKLKFKVKARGTSPVDLYARRAELLKYFCPTDDPLVLTVTLPDGAKRCIKCHLESGLNFERAKRSGYVQEADLVLNCPNPAFYDADPIVDGYQFKAGETSHSFLIAYAGTWRAYPILTIDGPWTNPRITHALTGGKVNLTVTLAAGQEIVIDLNPEKRAIYLNGSLRNDLLKSDSDFTGLWLTNLVAGPSQALNFAGSGQTVASWCQVQYNNQYLGI